MQERLLTLWSRNGTEDKPDLIQHVIDILGPDMYSTLMSMRKHSQPLQNWIASIEDMTNVRVGNLNSDQLEGLYLIIEGVVQELYGQFIINYQEAFLKELMTKATKGNDCFMVDQRYAALNVKHLVHTLSVHDKIGIVVKDEKDINSLARSLSKKNITSAIV